MEPSTRVSTSKARRTGRAHLHSQTAVCTLESSCRMKSVAKASTCGLMAKPMRDSGRRTRCMGMVYLHGRTVRSMKDTLLMIREKDKVNSHGKTVEFMMECGRTGSNMAEASLYLRTTSKG